jgi:hypothetical protein
LTSTNQITRMGDTGIDIRQAVHLLIAPETNKRMQPHGPRKFSVHEKRRGMQEE